MYFWVFRFAKTLISCLKAGIVFFSEDISCTMKQQHGINSDFGISCTLNFSAAGCECIHLTKVHVHCRTGILLIFVHARTQMHGDDPKQIKMKCIFRCTHGIV